MLGTYLECPEIGEHWTSSLLEQAFFETSEQILHKRKRKRKRKSKKCFAIHKSNTVFFSTLFNTFPLSWSHRPFICSTFSSNYTIINSSSIVWFSSYSAIVPFHWNRISNTIPITKQHILINKYATIEMERKTFRTRCQMKWKYTINLHSLEPCFSIVNGIVSIITLYHLIGVIRMSKATSIALYKMNEYIWFCIVLFFKCFNIHILFRKRCIFKYRLQCFRPASFL